MQINASCSMTVNSMGGWGVYGSSNGRTTRPPLLHTRARWRSLGPRKINRNSEKESNPYKWWESISGALGVMWYCSIILWATTLLIEGVLRGVSRRFEGGFDCLCRLLAVPAHGLWVRSEMVGSGITLLKFLSARTILWAIGMACVSRDSSTGWRWFLIIWHAHMWFYCHMVAVYMADLCSSAAVVMIWHSFFNQVLISSSFV